MCHFCSTLVCLHLVRLEVENLKTKFKILSSFVNNPKLMPCIKVKVDDILVPLHARGERIEDLKSQLRFDEKNFAQTKGKLLVAKTNCLLCDYDFVDCERTLSSSMKSLALAQEVIDLLVE